MPRGLGRGVAAAALLWQGVWLTGCGTVTIQPEAVTDFGPGEAAIAASVDLEIPDESRAFALEAKVGMQTRVRVPIGTVLEESARGALSGVFTTVRVVPGAATETAARAGAGADGAGQDAAAAGAGENGEAGAAMAEAGAAAEAVEGANGGVQEAAGGTAANAEAAPAPAEEVGGQGGLRLRLQLGPGSVVRPSATTVGSSRATMQVLATLFDSSGTVLWKGEGSGRGAQSGGGAAWAGAFLGGMIGAGIATSAYNRAVKGACEQALQGALADLAARLRAELPAVLGVAAAVPTAGCGAVAAAGEPACAGGAVRRASPVVA
ncbi:MAG: hypothetical protein KatS3mg121_0978 [Gammaproteobacteria bacterium]|nr:MAG: hypothetical protein KatS3mg121_0978 [Gammaproteobacteria bacterium]